MLAPLRNERLDEAEWDDFVNTHAEATGYHLWRWQTVFTDAFRHECAYFVARRNGAIAGVLPLVFMKSWLFGRMGVSLPVVNYGGLLSSTTDATDDLLVQATDYAKARNLAYIELRHRRRHFPDLPAKQHKVAMLLPLADSVDPMWSSLDRKVRNQIRKAEKSALDVRVGGPELLPGFYAVFAQNKRDLGTPVYSRKFFEAVLRVFPQQTRVFLVLRAGRPIGSAISFAYRQTIEVPWASSLKEFLACCPNNLLYWSVIQYAIANEFRVLDFGRSTPGEGTFHFKRQWGADSSPLFWEYRLLSRTALPDPSPKNPRFALAIEAWKRLPVRVTSLIGPSIVRGIP